MSETLDALADHLLVPVVVLDDPEQAPALTRALVDGGLPVAEITLRTPQALEVLRTTATTGDVLVGAGTVLSPGQVDDAVDAGARFVVSPGLSAEVVDRARARGVAVLPGVATPSDLMAATALGLDAVKLFPAGQLGGAAAVRALAAPFPAMRFVPTGGIGADDLADYLAVDAVAAVGGSWMVPADAVAAGDVDTVRTLVAAAVEAARRARTKGRTP